MQKDSPRLETVSSFKKYPLFRKKRERERERERAFHGAAAIKIFRN